MIPSNIPFFPIGLKPCKGALSEIALQFQSDCTSQSLNQSHFTYLTAVGRGGFGRVWKVEYKRNKSIYAMKEMQKLRIVSKRSVHSVINERLLLESLKHSFLVNMHYAFQDRENLYLVLDYKQGGDLRYHLSRHGKFSETQARFWAACILVGLEYLHSKNIIHRDIKPENLVLDEHGYLCITDFGIARTWCSENAKDTSGTPGYMAPEVLCRQNHSFSVDYFALGVILYEIMMLRRPYSGRDRKDIRDQILSKQVQIRMHEIPEGWSIQAADFVNQLLIRKANSRLGKDPTAVRNHPWLRDFEWKELSEKKMQAPYVPENKDNFDARVAGDWKDEIDANLQNEIASNLFKDYEFQVNSMNPESPGFVHKVPRLRLVRLS